MNILITGGCGYIGSNLSYKLSNNHKIFIIDNLCNANKNNYNFLIKKKNIVIYIKNLLNINFLKKILIKNKIDIIIHLAAYKFVNESLRYKKKYFENNVGCCKAIIESIKESKVKKIIFGSSASVYKKSNIQPYDENQKLKANNPYGNTKIACEKILEKFSKKKKLQVIILRYFNPIGYISNSCLEKLEQNEQIIPKFIKSLITKKKFNLYGGNLNTKDGFPERDFFHISDLVRAHEAAIKYNFNDKFNIFNIGSGKSTSTLTLIKKVENKLKVKNNYIIGKYRSGDVDKCYASIFKAEKYLRWKPKYSINQIILSIKKSIKYYK